MIWNQCRSKVVNTLSEWEGWFTQIVGAEDEDRKSRPFGGGLYTTVDKVGSPERYPAIAFIHFAHNAEAFFIYQDQILELIGLKGLTLDLGKVHPGWIDQGMYIRTHPVPTAEKSVEVLPEPIEDRTI
jgi:hypothetical protein